MNNNDLKQQQQQQHQQQPTLDARSKPEPTTPAEASTNTAAAAPPPPPPPGPKKPLETIHIDTESEYYYCHFDDDDDDDAKRKRQSRSRRVRSSSDKAKLEQMTTTCTTAGQAAAAAAAAVHVVSSHRLNSSPTPLMHSAASVSSEGRGRTLFELSIAASSASSISSIEDDDDFFDESGESLSGVSSAISHVSAWNEMEQYARNRADKLCPVPPKESTTATATATTTTLPTFSLAEVRLGALLERGTFTQVQEIHGFLLRSRSNTNKKKSSSSQQPQAATAEEARIVLAKKCRLATIAVLAMDKEASSSSSHHQHNNNKLPYSLKRLCPRLVRAASLHSDYHKSAALFWTGLVQLVVESRFLQQLEHPHIIELHGLGHCAATSSYLGINNKDMMDLDPFHHDFFLVLDGIQETLYSRIHKSWKVQLQALHPTTAAPRPPPSRRRRQPGERGKKSLSLPLLGGGGKKKNDFFSGAAAGAEPTSAPSVVPSTNNNSNTKNDFLRQRLSDARDISDALAHLHSKGICHRDIKPENIGYDQNGRIKIFDFGLARTLPKSNHAGDDKDKKETFLLSQMTGTLRYMAPEVVLGKRYSQSCDVYSFAMCFWEMLTCQTVFGEYITSAKEHDHCSNAVASAKNKTKRNKKKKNAKKTKDNEQDPKKSAQALIQKVTVDKARPPLYKVPLPPTLSPSSSSSTPSLSLPWNKGQRRQEQQQGSSPDPTASTISLSPGCQVVLGRAWHDDLHERWSMSEIVSKLDAEIHRLKQQPQAAPMRPTLQSSASSSSNQVLSTHGDTKAAFFSQPPTVHEGVEATSNDDVVPPPPPPSTTSPSSSSPSPFRFLRSQNRNRAAGRSRVPGDHYPMKKQTTPSTTTSVEEEDVGDFFQAPAPTTGTAVDV